MLDIFSGLFVWLTWPVRVFLLNVVHKMRLEGSTNHEKIDKHSANERAYQVYSSRAHLIEAWLKKFF